MTASIPFTRSRSFWHHLAYALGLGLAMGVVALIFLELIDRTAEAIWPDNIDTGFFGGEWWWLLLMGGLGLLVGLLRKLLKIREVIPGVFEDATERRVRWRYVPKEVIVAFVSLIGGMSLGPEGPLSAMGGGLGTWISEKRGLRPEDREANTVSGMSGAFGGLFAAPFLSTMLVTEAGAIGPAGYTAIVIPSLLAATLGFLVVFFVAGQVFLDVYEVAPFDVVVWDVVIAIPLGVVGALFAATLGITVQLAKRATNPLVSHQVLRSTIGGVELGLIAVAVPLTLFSGSDLLGVAIDDAETLGAGLLFAIVLGKIAAVALSVSTGFVGGVISPMIFIGGTVGAAIHQLIPDIPEALAISCLSLAVPAASARLPFTLLMISALSLSLTLGTPAAAAPAGLAGITSFVIVSGLRTTQDAGNNDQSDDVEQPTNDQHGAIRGDRESDGM